MPVHCPYHMHLLIVENNTSLGPAIATYLTDCGHTARVVANASAAIRATNAHRHHAIVIDADLPNREALSLIRRFRNRPHLGKLIVLATPNSLPASYSPGQVGISSIVEKPFHLAELLRELHTHVYPPGKPLEMAQLSIQPDTNRAHVGGSPLLLTAEHLELLKLFLQNPGRVLTEQLLAKLVWPQYYDLPISSLVRGHLRMLNQALKNAGCSLAFVAVSTIGYRLETL